MGMLIGSWRVGVAACVGSVVAIVVALFLGGKPDLVSTGLYGFSPVLTAVAFGAVFTKRQPEAWDSP